MNETIGVKGGHQDRIRTFKIKTEILKKIKNLDEKEKKRKIERVLIKTKLINIIKFVQIFTVIGSDLQETKEEEVEKEDKPIEKKEEKPKIVIEKIRSVERIPQKERSIEITTKIKEPIEEEKEDVFPYEDNYKPNISNIQNNKIIEEYQKVLKSIKKDLKTLVYEYKVIDQEEKNITTSEVAKDLLDRLNTIIIKLDKLKSKYNIDKIERYDENYIQVLIDDYIKDFHERKFVKEVKNSELYILISEKLDELYSKKEEIEDKIITKRNKLLITEEELEKLKEKYDEFDKFNIKLLEFQNEQDKILKEMNEELEKAVSVEEKVEIRLKAMDKQTKKLFNLVGLNLFLPIPKQIKKIVASTALYMYYLKMMIKPEFETKKYKVIRVEDYSNTINKSIESLEEAVNMIKSTSKEIEKIIESFKEEYKDYIGKNKKCDELLNSLEKISYEIKEKEEDINNIKQEQEKNLEVNKAKVKTLNNLQI